MDYYISKIKKVESEIVLLETKKKLGKKIDFSDLNRLRLDLLRLKLGKNKYYGYEM
jgi:hypothetical protein